MHSQIIYLLYIYFSWQICYDYRRRNFSFFLFFFLIRMRLRFAIAYYVSKLVVAIVEFAFEN